MINKLFNATALIASLLLHSQVQAYTPGDFAKLPKYSDAALSTHGTYLAVTIPENEPTSTGHVKHRIAVMRLSDKKVIQIMRFPGNDTVNRFFWDNDERLIMTVATQLGWDARPRGTGDVYSMSPDGSSRSIIYGPNSTSGGTGGRVVSRLIDDEKNILVQSFTGDIIKVNILSGTWRVVYKVTGNVSEVIFNEDDQAAFGSETNQKLYSWLFKYDEKNGFTRWKEFEPWEPQWSIIDVNAKDKNIIIRQQSRTEPDAFYRMDTQTEQREKIYQHPIVDADPVFSSDGRSLIAFFADAGFPEYHIVDAEHPEAKLLKKLAKAFPKSMINLLDVTSNGSMALFHASDSLSQGDYYLYDFEKGKASFLFAAAPHLDPNLMSPMEPVQYKARDGLTIHGYLTNPLNKKKGPVPMVVLVHGGPHGPRDRYGFDPEVQMMASLGYAVLQVNYRGSGGYGFGFQEAGYGKWGRQMQDDVTDATQWAIQQGIADKNKICIMGASYGGYAMSMGVVREPDLYKCGIGGVGVYDLTLMSKKGDIQRQLSGELYLDRVLGNNESVLKANSAVYNADKIKAPIFLWQGDLDERVPKAHYYSFAESLQDAGKPVDLMIKDREGHGFGLETNRVELFNKMAEFLKKHLGE